MCQFLLKSYRINFILIVTSLSLFSILLQTSVGFSSCLDNDDVVVGYIVKFPYLPAPGVVVQLDEGDDVQITVPTGLVEAALMIFVAICADIIMTPILVWCCLSVGLTWAAMIIFNIIIIIGAATQCVLVGELERSWSDAIPYLASTTVKIEGMWSAILICLLQIIIFCLKIAFYMYIRIEKIFSSYHFEE